MQWFQEDTNWKLLECKDSHLHHSLFVASKKYIFILTWWKNISEQQKLLELEIEKEKFFEAQEKLKIAEWKEYFDNACLENNILAPKLSKKQSSTEKYQKLCCHFKKRISLKILEFETFITNNTYRKPSFWKERYQKRS